MYLFISVLDLLPATLKVDAGPLPLADTVFRHDAKVVLLLPFPLDYNVLSNPPQIHILLILQPRMSLPSTQQRDIGERAALGFGFF